MNTVQSAWTTSSTPNPLTLLISSCLLLDCVWSPVLCSFCSVSITTERMGSHGSAHSIPFLWKHFKKDSASRWLLLTRFTVGKQRSSGKRSRWRCVTFEPSWDAAWETVKLNKAATYHSPKLYLEMKPEALLHKEEVVHQFCAETPPCSGMQQTLYLPFFSIYKIHLSWSVINFVR